MEKGVGGLPSAVLTGGLSLLLGAVCYAVFFAPFLQRSSLLSIVSTLALGTILESAVSMLFGVNVRSLDGGAGAESLELGGVFITQLQIAIIITALLLLGGVAFLIHSTRAGRMLRMLSEHPFAAESLGVGMKKTSVWVFLLSMLLTVYAGVMIGFETNLQPTMGQSYTIKPFAAMVLGGTGNVWGAVAGAYLLGLIENLSIGLDLGAFSLPAGYKDAFAYLFILLVLLFKPEGIFRPRARRA
jgi:branched-subunit amino acid ABC-type transport system permease component